MTNDTIQVCFNLSSEHVQLLANALMTQQSRHRYDPSILDTHMPSGQEAFLDYFSSQERIRNHSVEHNKISLEVLFEECNREFYSIHGFVVFRTYSAFRAWREGYRTKTLKNNPKNVKK